MSGFWTFLTWAVRILAGLFVAFHLYALALIWLKPTVAESRGGSAGDSAEGSAPDAIAEGGKA